MKIYPFITAGVFIVSFYYFYTQTYNPLREFAGAKPKIAYVQWKDMNSGSLLQPDEALLHSSIEDLILLDPVTYRTYTIPDVEFGSRFSFKEDGSALFFTKDDFNFASIIDTTDSNFRIYAADFLKGEVYKFFEHPGYISSLTTGKNGIYYSNFDELIYIPYISNQEQILHKEPELTLIADIKSNINKDALIFSLEYGLDDSVVIKSYNLQSKELTKLITIPQPAWFDDYSPSSEIIIYATGWDALPMLYNIKTGKSEIIPDSLIFNGLYISARKSCFYSQDELIIIGSYYSGKYSNDIFVYNYKEKKITRRLTFNGNLKFNLTVYKAQ